MRHETQTANSRFSAHVRAAEEKVRDLNKRHDQMEARLQVGLVWMMHACVAVRQSTTGHTASKHDRRMDVLRARLAGGSILCVRAHVQTHSHTT